MENVERHVCDVSVGSPLLKRAQALPRTPGVYLTVKTQPLNRKE
jgi:hypothetical protein